MKAMKLALGVISGTSMDGIDVAAIETDGIDTVKRLGGATYPYPVDLKSRLLQLVARPDAILSGGGDHLETDVTVAHAAALLRFLADAGLSADDVDVAGFHGQTVLHRPDIRFTRQLLDGDLAARSTGVPVVTQFRLADVAEGGQGAPLVPLYHRALAQSSRLAMPLAILNLGGVGNVTYLDDDDVIAFDTGPASALIDDWIRQHGRGEFDPGGQIAQRGRVDEDRLDRLMNLPFFALPPPKSLDRNEFHAAARLVEGMSVEDGAATLTAFTIAATAAARAHMPSQPKRWLVTGGGRLNATLIRGLQAIVGVPVDAVEAVGWDGDSLEAECFGYLAVRALARLPLSLPTTTGVPRPLTGGSFHGQGRNRSQ